MKSQPLSARRSRELRRNAATCGRRGGSIDNIRERLTGEEESSHLRLQRETMVVQLLDCAGKWASLTLARDLLDQIRQEFDTKRQPRVVRLACDFFGRITYQRHERFQVPMGRGTSQSRTTGEP